MNTSVRDIERKIIPRWRDSVVAATTGELQPLTKPAIESAVVHDELKSRIEDWKSNRSIPFATDLISSGLVSGADDCDDVVQAVDFIRSLGSMAPPSAFELAEFMAEHLHQVTLSDADLTESDPTKISSHHQIGRLKSRIRSYPRNALAWVDIARHYAILNSDDQAIRSIKNALALAPDNRFVLRSATRFFVHIDDPEQAYDRLRQNPATQKDPWLRAAEIAVAGFVGKTPRWLGRTKKALTRGSTDPAHISELASAVATAEMAHGSNRTARRLFNLGLERPTENAVAQADWADKSIEGISLNDSHFHLPRTFEANAVERYDNLELADCISECERWLSDEPFSSRPIELMSFVHIVGFDNYREAVDIAQRGLLSNPDQFLVRNNLSVALAESGDIEEAKKQLGLIRPYRLEPWEQTCWLGTKGLLAFRRNDVQRGRAYYHQAVDLAQHIDGEDLVTLALVFWGYEELNAGYAVEAEAILQRVKPMIGDSPPTNVKLAVRRFRELARRKSQDSSSNH